MHKSKLLLIVFLIIFVSGVTLQDVTSNEPDKKAGHQKRTIRLYREREQKAILLLDMRNKTIQELMVTVRSEPAPEKIEKDESGEKFHSEKHISIILLGGLRASKAVNILMENLLYRTPPKLWTTAPISREEFYPAAVALIRIGLPSVNPVLERLHFAESGDETNLCAWILVEILGKELSKTKIEHSIETIKREINKQPQKLYESWELPIVRRLRKCSEEELNSIRERLEKVLELEYFENEYTPYVLEKGNIEEEIISIYSGSKGK